ncbi:hypothetical protein [Rhodoflexus caldus]|uniref:hypothetical protein n=1 Tax=Rhodoflexus caldus TaxID=2891236 RepID=UPI00202A4BD8|nr:hypothetical protein [Rhodoflexus caldus]
MEAVEKYAAHGFNLIEIAIAIDVNAYEFLIACGVDEAKARVKTKEISKMSDLKKAFWKGMLTAEYQLRASIFKQATMGSTPAQSEMRKILQNQKL